MNLRDVNTWIAQHADTEGTDINVADVSRVMRCFFDLLASVRVDVMLSIVLAGMRAARKRRVN